MSRMKEVAISDTVFDVLESWKYLDVYDRAVIFEILVNQLHEADAIRAILNLIIKCANLRRLMDRREGENEI